MKRRDYSEVDAVSRAIDDVIVAYQPFTDVVEAAIRFAESPIQRGLKVVGESRVGKSTVASLVCRELNARAPAGQVWALAIEIPTNPSERTIAQLLILTLGNVSANGTEIDLSTDFVNIARECGLKLVLIDEFHHFVEGRPGVTHLARAANSLKGLMNKTKPVSYVVLGLRKTLRITERCEQLRGRLTATRELGALGQAMLENVADAKVRDESFRSFLNVLRALTRVLPFPNASELYSPELGRRMLSASQGRLGYIKPLLIGAVELAYERDERLLSRELLEAVFTRDIWSDGVGSKNPFNPHFKFDDRLDGPGEPFAPDGDW